MDDMTMPSPAPSQAMTFTTSHTTPLYSTSWTPRSPAAYTGTCIFLLLLAVTSRLISAYRHTLATAFHDGAVKRRYIRVNGGDNSEREGREKGEEAVLTFRGVDERVRVVKRVGQLRVPPWRVREDGVRAVGFVVQAGVGYLLMLAVMTMNVGYFGSVLGGLFVGELAVGRYSRGEDGVH